MRTVRDRLLQRCLPVLLNDLVSASETGAHCDFAELGRVLTVPRNVLYASDHRRSGMCSDSKATAVLIHAQRA